MFIMFDTETRPRQGEDHRLAYRLEAVNVTILVTCDSDWSLDGGSEHQQTNL